MKPATAATLRLLRLRGADGLTVAEARATIACDRLAARVCELRAAGYSIESVMERTPMGAHVARYYIRERPTPVQHGGASSNTAAPLTTVAFGPITGAQSRLGW